MKNSVSVPKVHLATGSESLISTSGASLLLQTGSVSGLATGLSQALAPWRKPLAVHDPAKMILDLAVAVAAGGDCLADVSLLRAQPEVFGRVASDPTISRLLDTLACDVDGALAAIRAARAAARAKVWAKVWDHQSPLVDDTQAIIDLDATLIGSHSEKELASPNYKRGFGFHPMMALTGAKADERAVLEDILANSPVIAAAVARGHQIMIGDKNYFGAAFEKDLDDAGIELSRPARKGERPRPGARFFKPLRQVIESINWTFKGQLDLERHGGRTIAGVCTRVTQRILALTAAIWHNDHLGLDLRRSLTAYDH